jgi:RimJ/RimL family protein N-acetyltransferase
LQLDSARLKLRPATLADAVALAPAYNGDAEFNRWSGLDEAMSPAQIEADMRETFAQPGGIVWRIDDHSGMLIGVAATALVHPPDLAWIALLLIRREFQGQGYGASAAELLEDHLFADPAITHIGLAVLTQNSRAQVFWEGRGYQRTQQTRDSQGHTVYKYALARRLSSC